jgi:hypothetical protein
VFNQMIQSFQLAPLPLQIFIGAVLGFIAIVFVVIIFSFIASIVGGMFGGGSRRAGSVVYLRDEDDKEAYTPRRSAASSRPAWQQPAYKSNFAQNAALQQQRDAMDRHRRSLNNPMNPHSPMNPNNPMNPMNPMNHNSPAWRAHHKH